MPLSTSAYVVPLASRRAGLEDWPSANGFTQAAAYAAPGHGHSGELTEAEKSALSRAAASISASLLDNI